MKITKLRAGIATCAIAASLGIGGFAIAAFVQTQDAQATSKAAKFAPVTVSGVVVAQNMLPGDSSRVTLTLENPEGNTVKAKVTSITPAGVVVSPSSVGGEAQAATCAAFVEQKTDDESNAALPILSAGQSRSYALNNGITLKEAAPIDCQGMDFTTKWSVTLEPIR